MILAVATLLGLVLGSFVTMLSARMPVGGDLFGGRSRCPHCGTTLGIADLVPLLSWLAMRGRCRHCGVRISVRYPLTEVAMALATALIGWRLGVTWPALAVLVLAVALLAMAVIDLEHGILPDVLQIAAALPAVVMVAADHAWLRSATGAAAGLAVGLALRYGFHVLRGRHGLGLGDVKFFAVAGLWLGADGLIPFFAVAGLLGIVFGLAWRRLGGQSEFPFGPALCVSLFLLVLFPVRL